MVNNLQLTLSRKEFNDLTNALKVALDNHLIWLADINYAMVCQPKSLFNFCSSDNPYRHCKLGLWYYHVDNPIILSDPTFIRIGEKHELLHKAVCHLVKSFAENGKPTTEIYKNFKSAEDTFLSLLKCFLHSSMEASVNTDFLTELPNRKALDLILQHEHARLKRSQTTSCIAMMDIDYFKKVNDIHGHSFGDTVLQEIAKLLITHIRDSDFAVRYGGEEFVIYFPDTDLNTTQMITDKLRAKIASFDIKTSLGQNISVTSSFGIALFSSNKTINESIDEADKALYLAKNSGRNKVVVSDKLISLKNES